MNNDTILKIIVLSLGFPLYWPVLKTLWSDLQKAMREEGGLWGPEPHPRKLEEIRRERAREEEFLVHEPRRPRGSQGFPKAASPGRKPEARRPGRPEGGDGRRGPRRPGFR